MRKERVLLTRLASAFVDHGVVEDDCARTAGRGTLVTPDTRANTYAGLDSRVVGHLHVASSEADCPFGSSVAATAEFKTLVSFGRGHAHEAGTGERRAPAFGRLRVSRRKSQETRLSPEAELGRLLPGVSGSPRGR
jgi:hypothetical protein